MCVTAELARPLSGAVTVIANGADADAVGCIQAADGGTLFLDEVAELGLSVQAKLLRVLETGEVLALGAARPPKVALRFCSATHRDLRAQVGVGKLREDLFFRIASPCVTVPRLRDRRRRYGALLWIHRRPSAHGATVVSFTDRAPARS